jgi:hypothetical protein
MRIAIPAALLGCALTLSCSKRTSPSSVSSAQDGASTNAPSASLPALSGFEGEISASVNRNKPGDPPIPFVLSVKSDKIRVDLPEQMGGRGNPFGGKAYFLLDAPSKKASIVSDAQKQAFVIDLAKSGEQLAGLKGLVPSSAPGAAAPNAAPPKVTKTGKLDTVAGYSCENWDIASDHRETTICVAQQEVSWFKIPTSSIPADRAAPWMTELLDGKHFPLRLVAYAKDGTTEETRIEVTKIDKRPLAITQFEYPATYRTVDLAQMFQGLANMPGGMPMRGPSPQHKAQ